VPNEIDKETGKETKRVGPWSPEEVFQHLACLYIKYVDIYRKLEDCYDQMVHPQKRNDIKRVVECTMLRICEIKHMLTEYNPRNGSLYVHLDQLLFDLKYDPSVIEIPVPRYFKDTEDNIELNVVFKEEVDRGGKKKKKKASKKKKKKKAAEEEEPPEKITLKVQEKYVMQAYAEALGYKKADEVHEIVYDQFAIYLDIEQSIKLIQCNERGR
jgi:hypothetical protein